MVPPLPDSANPSLVLAHPTPQEQLRIWSQTHPSWGSTYPIDAYLDREKYLLSAPLARAGGITPWILTTSPSDPARPVLASCETLRKPALLRRGNGPVCHVAAHGIASVFTYPDLRRRGYAARMLSLIAHHLAHQEESSPGTASFSVLFSDIGPLYYAALGWKPFESTHLMFAVPERALVNDAPPHVRTILAHDLPALAERDVELLAHRIALLPTQPSKTFVALAPTLEALQWHFAREAFLSTHLFSAVPDVHGALYTPPESPHARVWALWTRTQTGGKSDPDKNVMDIIRFVLEDQDAISDAQLSTALMLIIHEAQAQARQWLCSKIIMWNPDARLKAVVEATKHLDSSFVVRQLDSITSLRCFSRHVSAADMEWVDNQKFGWC
ncbi:hypothetical protein CDD82_3973 [Ophiocordyceps australis]|uniref:LYC1 C-terminal domain-containing protein n=1 Tax=Ophiocordyceps australis TaxID=1399860 RepID=A0A2C5Z8W7_9HYPO|nr:hypothetical protein CDD82_3973 [Ophiocordyceps australis]